MVILLTGGETGTEAAMALSPLTRPTNRLVENIPPLPQPTNNNRDKSDCLLDANFGCQFHLLIMDSSSI